ncbi:hypothetical protein [Brachyspira hyodysenteriae]|uniref:hypothetical protein n=1 Tax=Brachyspira hyodysenteriae TaxID=159 RepID=UPI0022CD39BA|nr:hypothetical protein [Brachyspira hyodysenteriae]MCZ9940615.1 hypothetical protein [Brachyspira hyodysenteriae]
MGNDIKSYDIYLDNLSEDFIKIDLRIEKLENHVKDFLTEIQEHKNKIDEELKEIKKSLEGNITVDTLHKFQKAVVGIAGLLSYSIYEAKKHIILKDNTNNDINKYILLKLINNGQNLDAQIVSSLDCYYNEELGGFYLINNEEISKYIPLVITKNGYYEIDYFDMYNNEVY